MAVTPGGPRCGRAGPGRIRGHRRRGDAREACGAAAGDGIVASDAGQEAAGRVTWEDDIRAREEEERRAVLARDVDSLQRLWSDEYAVNSPLDRVLQKDQGLELIRAGRILHRSLERRAEHIERHGDVVIVMGRETVVDPPDGKTLHRRYTSVWRQEGGGWRSIGPHANVISGVVR